MKLNERGEPRPIFPLSQIMREWEEKVVDQQLTGGKDAYEAVELVNELSA